MNGVASFWMIVFDLYCDNFETHGLQIDENDEIDQLLQLEVVDYWW